MRRLTVWFSILLLVALALCWGALVSLSEEFLPATLLAYGPRAFVLIPVAVGILTSLMFSRASLVINGLSASIALVGIMGLRLHFDTRRPSIATSSPSALRVLTVNAQGGVLSRNYLPGLIKALRPDITSMQECGEGLWLAVSSLKEYYLARHSSICVLSRWPLSSPDSMPRAAFARVSALGYGGTALVVRYRVAHVARPFDFVTLHLETPRKGFERLMPTDGFVPESGGLPRLGDMEGAELNARIRQMESERASAWAARFADSVPLVIAGDFNLPVESAIFRRFWTGFHDAFEEAGFGFGYTKFENRFIKARIDHILFAPAWIGALRAWVGPDVGSDHKPVVADLRFER